MSKRRDLKIMWSSNGVHTNSGYAVESRDLLFRFIKDGWSVACNSFWGVQGFPLNLYGHDLIDDRFKGTKLTCYPSMNDPWGADGLVGHSMHYQANVAFTFQDVWPLDVNQLRKIKYFVPYVPIDKDPVPPSVLEKLQFAYRIVTFSCFGQKALQKAGFTSTLIVEGTDTEIFRPIDKVKCREEFKVPQDAFAFGMIAANKENPPRKGFQEAMEAFKKFHDNHPEAALCVHTQQPSPAGFPIQQFASHLGFADRLFIVDPYLAIWHADSKVINKEMNTFDVLLHPSQTEGFGLTIVEAQSAGIPVVVNGCHSMPELVVDGKTGFVSKTGKPRWTNDLSYVYPSDVDSLYDQMEKAYKTIKDNPNKVKNDCRKFVMKNYNIDTIYKENWVPLLEKLQDEILTAPPQSDRVETPGK